MKNTRKNVMELLEKKEELAYRIACHFEEKGDKEESRMYMQEVIAIEDAIKLLKDNNYFNEMYKIINS